MLREVFEFALDTLFPISCRVCGVFDVWLCDVCQSRIAYLENQICLVCAKPSINGYTHPDCGSAHTVDGLLAVCAYKQIHNLIHDYKYSLIKNLDLPLAETMCQFIESQKYVDFLKNFVVVAVPLHRSRQKFRGFNQSETLATQVCERFGLEQKNLLLARSRNTPPQANLGRSERSKNVIGAFTVNDTEYMKGKKILLIDDIATTGSTLNECAKVLKKNGAQAVWALVLAHG